MSPTRILVPVLDDSDATRGVIEYAGFLAEMYGATVEVLYVARRQAGRVSAEAMLRLRSVLERGEEIARRMCSASESEPVRDALIHVMAGEPEDVIPRFGGAGYDMILLSDAIDLGDGCTEDGAVDLMLNRAAAGSSLLC